MEESLRIATWNIAGAHTIMSDGQFDYAPENIGYFVKQLRHQHPEVICLQEAHTDGPSSNAQEIARKLQMPYVYELDCSISHIDSGRRLGLAIISIKKLTFVKSITYPYPPFADWFADGRPAQHHDKKAQVYRYKDLSILNTQMLPLSIFGKNYEIGEGADLALQIDDMLVRSISRPCVAAGDFNFDDVAQIYPRFQTHGDMHDSLPPNPTRPKGDSVDHILVSQELMTCSSTVTVTSTDHYLCVSTIRWRPQPGII